MKLPIKLIGIAIVLFSLISCAGGKDVLFEQDPPFKIKMGTYQKWVSGVQGGGKGWVVTIYMGTIMEDIKVKDIYYLDTMVEAKQDPRNVDKYTGYFMDEESRDITMEEDPRKEAGNTPPVKSPFTLEPNEAVLSYLHEGEVKFYKMTNLVEKPVIAYPGAKPNGMN